MPEARLERTRRAYEPEPPTLCWHDWMVDTVGSEVCRKCGKRPERGDKLVSQWAEYMRQSYVK